MHMPAAVVATTAMARALASVATTAMARALAALVAEMAACPVVVAHVLVAHMAAN